MRASRGGAMGVGEFVAAGVSAGVGFLLADGLDRFLATYNPSGATAPTDKYTSPGTGTLANTLNIATMPNWKRAAAGVGAMAAPAVGSMFVKNPFVKSSLEGMAIGAGVSAVKLLVQNVLLPMIVGKTVDTPSLQKSVIARLYPAETAAHVNHVNSPTSQPIAPGALSGPPPGQDVGPFALAGSSDYPDAAQVLRRQAGMSDQFPTLQNAWGTGGPGADYPTAAQAMGVGADQSAVAPPAPGTAIAPNVTAVAPPAPPAAVAATAANVAATISATVPGVAPAQAAAAGAAVAVAPPTPAAVAAVLQAAIPQASPATVAAATPHVHAHVARLHGQSAWQPGPPSVQNPGPQAQPNKDCGCVGEDLASAGLLGDTLPDQPLYS